MQYSPSATAQAIEVALQGYFKNTLGVSSKAEFKVENVETKLLDIHYYVSPRFECVPEVEYLPLGSWSGDRLSKAEAIEQAALRQKRIIQNPAKDFAEEFIAYLKKSSASVLDPQKTKIWTDHKTFMYADTCHSCAGHGEVNCGTCYGRGKVNCSNCDGCRRAECNACHGLGNIGGSPTCYTCSGSGVYLSNRCSSCSGTGDGPGRKCGHCYGDGITTCHVCSGSGDEVCSRCDHGKVGCGVCRRSGHVACVTNYVVNASPVVQARWEKINHWSSDHIGHAFAYSNTRSKVFEVSTVRTSPKESGDFVCEGKLLATQAMVTYKGVTRECHFFGRQMLPVNLNGLAESEMDELLERFNGVKRVKKIKALLDTPVLAKIMNECLIDDVSIEKTSAVKSGLATKEQVKRFIIIVNDVTKRYSSVSGKLSFWPVMSNAWAVACRLVIFFWLAAYLGDLRFSSSVDYGILETLSDLDGAIDIFMGHINKMTSRMENMFIYGLVSIPLAWIFFPGRREKASMLIGGSSMPFVFKMAFALLIALVVLSVCENLTVTLTIDSHYKFKNYLLDIVYSFLGALCMLPTCFALGIIVGLARYRFNSVAWASKKLTALGIIR